MASKKKRTEAEPIKDEAIQADEPVAEAAATEAPEPIAVKRARPRRERIEIGSVAPDDEAIPESVSILPLRNAVLFPMTGLPLEAAQPRSLRLIDAVVNGDRRVVFVAQKDKEVEGAGPDDLYTVGTLGVIQQMLRMPDGNIRLGVQGLERVRIGAYPQEEPYLLAK